MIPRKFTDKPCSTCGTPKAVVSGAWLRWRRREAGLTLREMARRLGYSAPYICDVELSRRACSPKIKAAYEAL